MRIVFSKLFIFSLAILCAKPYNASTGSKRVKCPFVKEIRGDGERFCKPATSYQLRSHRVSLTRSTSVRSLASTQSPLISVIVPCFNEARTVVQLLKSVRAALPLAQIIVVDDRSTDGSGALIEGLVHDLDLRHLQLASNQGKGVAFRAGLGVVDREYVVVQDADLEYNPKDICRLLQHAVEHRLDAVYGSRYLNGGSANRGALANYVAVKLLSIVLRVVHGLRLSDPATCYKLFRSELVKSWPLRSQGFELCQELNTQIARGYRFAELRIGYIPRTKPLSWLVRSMCQ